jgi:hypothetical protein
VVVPCGLATLRLSEEVVHRDLAVTRGGLAFLVEDLAAAVAT